MTLIEFGRLRVKQMPFHNRVDIGNHLTKASLKQHGILQQTPFGLSAALALPGSKANTLELERWLSWATNRPRPLCRFWSC